MAAGYKLLIFMLQGFFLMGIIAVAKQTGGCHDEVYLCHILTNIFVKSFAHAGNNIFLIISYLQIKRYKYGLILKIVCKALQIRLLCNIIPFFSIKFCSVFINAGLISTNYCKDTKKFIFHQKL